jgi:peroxiredoxin
MLAKFKLFTYLLILLSLFGCNPDSEKTTTYFGGKIINPRGKFVVLYEKEEVVDTFYLNRHNKFLGKIDNLQEGLFVFKHGPEHQYVYIEPKDSILIRLNTWDFDESLVFSGIGGKRNNLLIDCFLDAEKDDKFYRNLYNLSPTQFKNKVLALEKQKKARLKELLSRFENESKEFKKLLEISLIYPVYRRLENYPLVHKEMTHEVMNEKIDEDFYSHRKFIDYKKDSIMYYSAYRDYMVSYLYNVVANSGHKMYSDKFTTELLHTIDKHFLSESTRNTLLRQTVISHFYRKSSCDINNDAFETFLKLTSNNDDVKLVRSLLKDIKKVHKGKKLAHFEITDLNNSNHPIQKIIKGKDVVLYFWNPKYVTKEYLFSKVNYLSKKYPNIEFVGIRIDGKQKDYVKKLDIKTQYYLTEESKANEFLTSRLPRTMLINKKGIVVNAYASLSSQNIYNQVASLAKN